MGISQHIRMEAGTMTPGDEVDMYALLDAEYVPNRPKRVREVSALPWKLTPKPSGAALVDDARNANDPYGSIGLIYQAVDAAFIVKACNSFDDLCNAIDTILQAESIGFGMGQAITAARAALKRAEEA